ncbi:MAG: hypothetical protein K5776_07335 [Lachnospiraceae bacterium]|nr:hypothetical protein [Lachnospiraceae bacterium]
MKISENATEVTEKRDILEWTIETDEGKWNFVDTFKIEKGPAAEVVFIYSFDECARLGIPLTECPNALVFYKSDLKFLVEDGFAKVTYKDDILFMMQRRLIKNIITKVNGEEMK